jgi:hypothetical protein
MFIFFLPFFDSFDIRFYRTVKIKSKGEKRRKKMTIKKQFNKIAELVDRHTPQGTFIIKEDFVKELADFFESDNPNFHRGKFIHACYNKAKNKAA